MANSLRSIRYRAAVVGCGRIGVLMEEDPRQPRPATHAGAFNSNDRITLAALVDHDEERQAYARTLFPKTATFSGCREMLTAINPEIVAVATPAHTHSSIVALCAEAGVRAIVCEKPIAIDPREGRQMIESCGRAGSMLFVNHTRRFDRAIRCLRDEIASGVVGEIVQVSCYYTAGILNTGTHVVDLLRFLVGEPSWVMAVRNDRGASPESDLGVDAIVQFASGARAMLQFLDVRDYSIFDVHLFGRKGSLLLTGFGFEVERTGLKPRTDVSGYWQLDLEGRTREGTARSLMRSMAEHVVDCLDGRDTPISRGEDGLAALETVVALRESAARGGVRVVINRLDTIP